MHGIMNINVYYMFGDKIFLSTLSFRFCTLKLKCHEFMPKEYLNVNINNLIKNLFVCVLIRLFVIQILNIQIYFSLYLVYK
jgi:hypothetical protein